ncbi:hypothetical protein GGI07_004013 [Coemansia sp. Benny D115]|nr:hypothetical protein GGI07_004013 [Coemansia sp. Benny D115]
MQFSIFALAALASSAFAAVSINNPVANTVWPHDGSPVTISWISDDGSVLTGTVTVQLMEGADPNNLLPILTIESNYPASAGKVTFVPPSTLRGSTNYAVRVTSSVDGPHYSHSFQAGNPEITAEPSSAVSTSSAASSSKDSSKSTSEDDDLSTDNEEDSLSTDDDEKSTTAKATSKTSSQTSHKDSSSDEQSDSDSESDDGLDSEKHSSSSGSARVVVGGVAGAAVAVVAALF